MKEVRIVRSEGAVRTMIKKIDHLVITTGQIENCISFYEKLGFSSHNAGNRFELKAGDFKINVHIRGKEIEPHAENIQTGSADLCFEVSEEIEGFVKHLDAAGLTSFSGIVERHGVKGKMKSVYLRDPDGNLVEFSSYVS